MRSGLFALAVAVWASPALAADPPIVFQTQPVGQLLDEVRAAADKVGGKPAVEGFNKMLKRNLGDKGFEGIDITRPVVGYVVLAPKPEDIVAVVALPVTGEKEFLDLCDRANPVKAKADPKDKGLYHLPPLDTAYKAQMRFSEQYAYIVYGLHPEPHVTAKALAPVASLYDPAERGLVAGRVHFDRIPLAVKLAAPVLLGEVKKTLQGGFGRELNDPVFKAAMPEIEKLLTRYVLLAAGADVLTARLLLDPQTADLIAEATLTGKPGSELAKIIADRKPTANKFAGLLTSPDMAAGFEVRLPLFEPEIRAAVVAGLEVGQKDAMMNAREVGKKAAEELFKGLIRTVKTGEFDVVGAVRGPDKNGHFTAVGAVAFEDPSALEKEFKTYVQRDAPQDIVDAIKWDADKAGTVAIHTWKPKGGGFLDFTPAFGADDCLVAFAFAPHGVFGAIGPDPVKTLKEALAVKPADSPVLDVVVNPARMMKFVQKMSKNDVRAQAEVEAVLGKEDRLVSILSATLEGGKQLKARVVINLKVLPRYWVREVGPVEPDIEPPPVQVEKK